MEESEGFEPSVPLPALRISSATLSTTQPTLLAEADAPFGGLMMMQPSRHLIAIPRGNKGKVQGFSASHQ